MSVTEHSTEEGGYGRTPPHDIMAEQSVLGGMLLSKEAISQVVEIVRAVDFYRPAHQTIFEVVVDLFSRGEPVDAISVNAELTKRGEVARVGGAPYLHTLTESIPTAANAGYYARIVGDRAVLRRLVEAGTRIAQIGYSGDGEVDDLVDHAQAEVFRVAERRTGEDYLALSDVMPGALDEIEAISAHDGSMTGVPTGFTDFDQLSNGLHPGQMVIVAARPAVGKALALDTPLPTPHGWTTMGAVEVGAELLAADGSVTRVVAATGTMTGRPCYELAFDDGTTVVADTDHQWLTTTRADDDITVGTGRERDGEGWARPEVRTTSELAQTLHGSDRRPNHAVRTTAPLLLSEGDLPVPPYFLGAWLGGGDPTGAEIIVDDPEPALHIEDEGFVTRLRSTTPATVEVVSACAEQPHPRDLLAVAGVLGGRHIPADFLRSSITQRRALLAGVLDTAGMVCADGTVQVAVPTKRLAADLRDLLHGLGHRTVSADDGTEPREGLTVRFAALDDVFRAPRKKIAHKEYRESPGHAAARRLVTAVRPVPSVPVRCVQVDHPDGLFLATRSMLPTHNSTLALDFARAASIKNQLASVIFSLEMGRNEIVMRLLSAEARVPLHTMRSGLMTDDDWARLARRMGEVASAPLFIDDSPNMSMMEIRAKCRRLKQQHDLKLIIVDYLQLMSAVGRVESRQQEVSEMSRSLKLLAKELDVPVVALSQLNRGPEQRTDKKPQVSDLRESGCLTADTRILRADTGTEITLGELFASGERDLPVWALDDSLRLVRATMSHVFHSGVKETFRLCLRSGRAVVASANHPFLAPGGWRPLGDLAVSERIAVPWRAPTSGGADARPGSGAAPPPAAPPGALDAVVTAGPVGGGLADGGRLPVVSTVAGRARRGAAGIAERADVGSTASSCDTGRVARLTNDVYWDEIVAIEPLGAREVFDATVPGVHNFVANGISVHNSIEQDADMVILLYREDVHEKESPRAGEADLIVAKHRNGPTATVTVAFQGHYSRFVDMAPG